MGMPSGPLSSNWELLKKRLSAGQASQPAKRKPSSSTAATSTTDNPSKKRRRSDDDAAPSKPKPKHVKPNTHALRKARTMTAASDAAAAAEEPKAISASLALWAEDYDIPAEDLARAYNLPLTATGDLPIKKTAEIPTTVADPQLTEASQTEVGKYIAMDCEMVGVGEGDHESSALARVSVVNFFGHCVLDCFVKPKEKVTDWRTWVSGVSPKDMVNAISFEEAQKKVSELMNGRILIGHAIKNDLECLLIGHPKRDIRDTSRHPEFRKYSKGRTPALKKLAKEVLGIEIQGGSHSSIEDARACMLLYRRFKDEFERENAIKFPNAARKSGGGKKKKKSKK